MHEIFILTDSTGFVTCVAEIGVILRESARRPLLAPITVHRWIRNSKDWVFVESFTWP